MTSILLSGVRKDVETFLCKFVNKKQHTYESFSEVWKEMEFYYIFSGRPTVLEMKNFTRELLLLVKSFTVNNYTVWEKSAAIFLLYALYFNQPLSQKVPIRIELNEWLNLRDFIDKLKLTNLEVCFCFYKLFVNHAFDFVYSNKPFTIESLKEEELPLKKENSVKSKTKHKYDKFAMGTLLTSIGFDPDASSSRETKYNDIKQLLNQQFPEICNFDVRRFAVNLLVPKVDEEQSGNQGNTSGSKKKKRKGKRKTKNTKDPLLFNSDEEDDDIDNNVLGTLFSMPEL